MAEIEADAAPPEGQLDRAAIDPTAVVPQAVVQAAAEKLCELLDHGTHPRGDKNYDCYFFARQVAPVIAVALSPSTADPARLWNHWRATAAERLSGQAEDLQAGGGPDILNEEQKDIAAQTWRNAASKIGNMPMPPLPR